MHDAKIDYFASHGYVQQYISTKRDNDKESPTTRMRLSAFALSENDIREKK